MNCIAVDDEPLALNLMESFVNKVSFLTLKAKCKSAFEAIEVLKNERIDLIFLDIHMPDLSGIDFIKNTPNLPLVIFTTAYDNHALEGFELDVIDYLIKPIPFNRFVKAANKAYDFYNLNFGNRKAEPINDFMFVKADYQLVRINFAEINYIEGLKDYVKVNIGHKNILTLLSMKAMEEKLPASKFMRIHRSFIVSLDKIESVKKSMVKVGDKNIPISDMYRDSFFERIEKHS